MRGQQADPQSFASKTAASGMAVPWVWAQRWVRLADRLASWTAASSRPRGAGTTTSSTTSGGSSSRVTVRPSAPWSANAGELRLTFPPTMPGHGMGTQPAGPGACPAALDR
jgi:hypothetical protein